MRVLRRAWRRDRICDLVHGGGSPRCPRTPRATRAPRRQSRRVEGALNVIPNGEKLTDGGGDHHPRCSPPVHVQVSRGRASQPPHPNVQRCRSSERGWCSGARHPPHRSVPSAEQLPASGLHSRLMGPVRGPWEGERRRQAGHLVDSSQGRPPRPTTGDRRRSGTAPEGTCRALVTGTPSYASSPIGNWRSALSAHGRCRLRGTLLGAVDRFET